MLTRLLIAAATFLCASPAMAQVRVIISGGFSTAYRQVLPEFEKSTGIEVTTTGWFFVRAVGMVFQQFNLFPHMSALKNVMSGPVHALEGHETGDGDLVAHHRISQRRLTDIGSPHNADET